MGYRLFAPQKAAVGFEFSSGCQSRPAVGFLARSAPCEEAPEY